MFSHNTCFLPCCIGVDPQVRDGSDQTGDLLGSFCGTVNPAPLTSTENVLFIEMRSDSSMNGAGFQATWSTGKSCEYPLYAWQFSPEHNRYLPCV